jgi:signal transduction histidine kinase
VRSRLLLLIVIPTTCAVVLGGISIASSVGNALAFQRAETLATLGQRTVGLAQALEDERDQVVVFIATSAQSGGRNALLTGHSSAADAELSVVNGDFASTNRVVTAVRSLASGIGDSYSPQARQAAQVVLTALSGLRYLRDAATSTKLPALIVVQEYTQVIDDILAFDAQVGQAASDPALAQTVQVLGLVSAMQEVASEQRGLLAAALLAGSFGPGELDAMQAAQSAQQSALDSFDLAASVSQQQEWNTSVNKSFVYLANSEELQAISLQNSNSGSLVSDPITPTDWFGAMSNTVDIQMGSVEKQLTAAIIARAEVLRKRAITGAVIIGVGVLLVLLLALILTMIIGRSMVRPLRRLRAGALDIAGIRLPETVRRMSEADGENVTLDVDPIDVESFDEIGEVARAFDQVHREALRLAANEAALRGNVNAMFVNLSRRSQSLVERQIRLIDDLEQGEQDSERLGSLFQMDHLATRMRRNSENLLVLAGHESTRRWNQPVPLVDVLRAAISEIEQYERVMLNVQPGISVRGPAVNDVVHLIAELAENATSFSSADTPVSVSGHLLSSGGVLLDITDLGVGMGAEEMAHANWRLDNPPVVDVAVSRRMGLFVVARLAARHGIRVRLRPASGAGLTALVWLPDEVVARDTGARPTGPIRLEEPATRFAIGAGSAATAGPGQRDFDAFGGASGIGGAGRFAAISAHDSGPIGPLDPASIGALGQGPAGPDGSIPVGTADFAPPAAGQTDWAQPGPVPGRPSRFAPEQDGGAAGPLGPPRIPGAGPHPGSYVTTTTGPIPAFGGDDAGRVPFDGFTPARLDGGDGAGGPVAPMPPVGDGAGGGWPAEHPSQPAAASWADQAEPPTIVDIGEPSQVVLGAPVAGARASSGTFRSQESHFGSTGRDVIVPVAASLGEENRLPIFEAVESDWFRRGRPSVDLPSTKTKEARTPVAAAATVTAGWSSPADEGWRAAEAAAAPSAGGMTRAGLPRRVPQANLIPGTAAETTTPAPVRSASVTRERFASLQRGMREGRAASGDGSDGTGDVPGDG